MNAKDDGKAETLMMMRKEEIELTSLIVGMVPTWNLLVVVVAATGTILVAARQVQRRKINTRQIIEC